MASVATQTRVIDRFVAAGQIGPDTAAAALKEMARLERDGLYLPKTAYVLGPDWLAADWPKGAAWMRYEWRDGKIFHRISGPERHT